MDAIIPLIVDTINKVWVTFTHNWPFLIASTIIAVYLNHALNPQKVAAFFKRNQASGVIGSVAVAVATPLCSCGTTAVLLGMMASMMPWAPIVAFMVASPLTSPQELVYSAGLFGWPFALTFFGASIVLGLVGGLAAHLMEQRGWLKNQVRFVENESSFNTATTANDCGCSGAPVKLPEPAPVAVAAAPCGCGDPAPVIMRLQPAAEAECGCGSVSVTLPSSRPEPAAASCGCLSTPVVEQKPSRLKEYVIESAKMGGRLLWMFGLFAFVGYFLNGLIPQEWVSSIFGAGNIYSVPLAATLGLPLYINTEASLPLVRGLIDGGMSQGAALAFLITGAGTSVGAVAGMLTIARWRVIALVIGILWAGSILIGMLYNLVV
jgi:uncharacterized membrane protein YraQ (UPF0718 family)